MTRSDTALAAALDPLRDSRAEGTIDGDTVLAPGLTLHADPGLGLTGRYRSPAGRLLELELAVTGSGGWLALHLALDAGALPARGWLGFACTGAADHLTMIRPCLRSGTAGGFADCFFARHMLAEPEPRSHVDALQLDITREIPPSAPWRELVLFLPRTTLTWHLHDLRPFLI